ncbi:hypothetical protein [Proteus terrae]
MIDINEVGKKILFTSNKIVSIGEKIKLSISNLPIKVKNTISEFIHPNRHENKIVFNAKNSFLKSKNLIISNKEKNNIGNKRVESNPVKDETIESDPVDDKTIESIPVDNRINFSKESLQILNERLQVLSDIELPNGDLVPIDEAIDALHLCQQDSLLKSKLSLIDYITDMNFKSSIKTQIELSNKLDAHKNEQIAITNPHYDSINEQIAITNSHYNRINESKNSFEKKYFKSFLLQITKDISLLDRLSDDNNSYGYVFLAKVANYLEDYNKNKGQEKTDCFNKDTYLKKLSSSDYFFKLNKRVNDIIYLQYLKKEQSTYENGVVEKIIVTVNNTLNEGEKLQEAEKHKKVFAVHDKLNENNMSIIEKQHKDQLTLINNDNLFDEFLADIDSQLNIANENKKLTLKELLAKVKK